MMRAFLASFSVLVLGSFFTPSIYAQVPEEVAAASIFDEGVDESILPQDIGEDVRQWAQNTALKLQKLLTDLKELLSPAEKRVLLVKTIQESVLEAQGHRELLLMRFC